MSSPSTKILEIHATCQDLAYIKTNINILFKLNYTASRIKTLMSLQTAKTSLYNRNVQGQPTCVISLRWSTPIYPRRHPRHLEIPAWRTSTISSSHCMQWSLRRYSSGSLSLFSTTPRSLSEATTSLATTQLNQTYNKPTKQDTTKNSKSSLNQPKAS